MSLGGRHRTWQGARSMGASSQASSGTSQQRGDAGSLTVTDGRKDLVDMAETVTASQICCHHLITWCSGVFR